MPPSSMSSSGSRAGCGSGQNRRSLGCTATGASSLAATSTAAAAWLACPCVQITAITSRSPTAASTGPASRPGSTTMTSWSSPIIQVLTVVPACSIRASMATCLLYSALPDERTDRADYQLHRNGRQQQSGNPGDQLRPAVAQYPEYLAAEPHRQPQHGDPGHNAEAERHNVPPAVSPLHQKQRP